MNRNTFLMRKRKQVYYNIYSGTNTKGTLMQT